MLGGRLVVDANEVGATVPVPGSKPSKKRTFESELPEKNIGSSGAGKIGFRFRSRRSSSWDDRPGGEIVEVAVDGDESVIAWSSPAEGVILNKVL